jgi:hypothetical protein
LKEDEQEEEEEEEEQEVNEAVALLRRRTMVMYASGKMTRPSQGARGTANARAGALSPCE